MNLRWMIGYSGRINRTRYWIGAIGYWILMFVTIALWGFICRTLEFHESTSKLGVALIIYAVWVPLFTQIMVKRLHDLGYSAWHLIPCFIPVINIYHGISMGFFIGDAGPNKFGPDPLGRSKETSEQAKAS